jgi:hypothetical protein
LKKHQTKRHWGSAVAEQMEADWNQHLLVGLRPVSWQPSNSAYVTVVFHCVSLSCLEIYIFTFFYLSIQKKMWISSLWDRKLLRFKSIYVEKCFCFH